MTKRVVGVVLLALFLGSLLVTGCKKNGVEGGSGENAMKAKEGMLKGGGPPPGKTKTEAGGGK